MAKENIDPDCSQEGKVSLSKMFWSVDLKKNVGDDLETLILPIPSVKLKMTALLDLSNKYHTGMVKVDSISSMEIKWEDKVSFEEFSGGA